MDRSKIEIDVAAESYDRSALMLGEVKLSLSEKKLERVLFELERKSKIFPLNKKYNDIKCFVFVADFQGNIPEKIVPHVILLEQVLDALK